MKYIVTILVVLTLGGSWALIASDDDDHSDALVAFEGRLQRAFNSDDLHEISELYHWGDTDQVLRDQAIGHWQHLRRYFTIRKMEFLEIDNSGVWWGLHPKVTGETMNGRTYKPNVEPTHVLRIEIVDNDGGMGRTSETMMVHVSDDGVCFPGVTISGTSKG